jgi:hypothetical protein
VFTTWICDSSTDLSSLALLAVGSSVLVVGRQTRDPRHIVPSDQNDCCPVRFTEYGQAKTMENGLFKIVCFGKDRFLLELLCQVLSRTGYDAQAAFIPEAYERLRSMRFDLAMFGQGGSLNDYSPS